MNDADGRATESLGGEVERRAIRGFLLRITSGPGAGKLYCSDRDRVVIGTHASTTLPLQDSTVSRFHSEVVVDGDLVRIRDLGSLNGTIVNGVRVLDAVLEEGAVIAIGRTQLRFELAAERPHVPVSTKTRFGLVVGRSFPMARAFAALERAAASDATVLLEGETGTGKEIVAESIHRASARAERPFVVVDCAAVPPTLAESELFGHEKGAFTGAATEREGAFEAAASGTLFLDEIGDLPIDLQPKLLRALERHEIKRVGAGAYTKVDVRVVAATNKNLRAEVNEKRFRADLYYRLAVVELRLPPLRERVEDVPLLVEDLLAQLGARMRPEAHALRTPEFLASLARHSWPGNVRELRNYLERCLTLSETAPLEAADAEASPFDPSLSLREGRERCVAAFERRYLEEAIRRAGGNMTAAARASGIDRIHFYRLLWRHGLR